jgi:sulfoxide reductase heme-binding subunit YedZ
LNSILTSKWTKVLVFIVCLLPVAWIVWRGFHGDLTADPITFITHTTGDWTLRFLVITLAITPLRKILRQPQLIRFRRMLGLFAFFYACLHFSTWIGLDKFFNWNEMWKDVAKRPFITVGFTGFVLMIPLAITSTAGMIRRLGGRRWQMLHRLIYVSAIAGAIHYYWLVKSDETVPLRFAAVVAILLGYRVFAYALERRRAAARVSTKQPAISD